MLSSDCLYICVIHVRRAHTHCGKSIAFIMVGCAIVFSFKCVHPMYFLRNSPSSNRDLKPICGSILQRRLLIIPWRAYILGSSFSCTSHSRCIHWDESWDNRWQSFFGNIFTKFSGVLMWVLKTNSVLPTSYIWLVFISNPRGLFNWLF